VNYEKHAETGGANMTRAELREACKTLGKAVGPNESEESMRKKFCDAMGVVAPAEVKDISESRKKSGGVPNLSSNGTWGGKWYYVTIGTTIKDCKAYPCGWQGVMHNIGIDRETKVSAAHFQQIRSALGIANFTGQESYVDTDGVTKYRLIEQVQPEFFIKDWRVDPETAHLPESYCEFFRNLAKKSDNFKGYTRKQLRYIAGILADWMKAAEIEKLEDDAIRELCLRQLGIVIDDEILGLEVA
jgi:hypothetical protein